MSSQNLGASRTTTSQEASIPPSENGSGLPVRPNRPPRQKVGKACENCRRRRVKCDGIKPFCGTCRAYNDECLWTPRTDYRKPLSRQQVDALRSRIADLEGLLRTHGILVEPIPDGGNDGNHTDVGHGGIGKEETVLEGSGSGSSMAERITTTDKPGPGAKARPAIEVSVGMNGADVLQQPRRSEDQDQVEQDDWPNSHLVENETGEFQVFGPTSSLRHLVAFRQSSVEREREREHARPGVEEPVRPAPGIGTSTTGGRATRIKIAPGSGPHPGSGAARAKKGQEVDKPGSSQSLAHVGEDDLDLQLRNIGGEMDFRRYLPRDVVISRGEHDEALDQFFRYHASWGQQTHPVHFRTDMQLALSPASTSNSSSSARARTAHYSPMLHNAILSIGLRFLSHSSSHSNHDLSSLDTLRKFSDEAKKHMRTEGMNPSVATVQALAHLASHHNLMAEHNLGWLQIGMAVRCGLTLGLNVDPALLVRSGRLTEAQARDRNVTYWMTFVQEGLWAPYIGRPVNWPAHTTTPPLIDASLDQLPWVAPSGRLALDSQPGMISSAFVETVKLMAIGDKILNTLYGITADLVALSRSGAISDIRRVGISSIRLHKADTIVLVSSLSLSTWLEALPPALKLNSHSIRSALPHILTMHISWASFMIMLHKPFYRPLVNLPTTGNGEQPASNHNAMLAVKQCDRAAVQIVSLLQTWHKLHDLRFAPPCILESCFTAGTTHLLAYTCARTQRKQLEALARAKECTRLMETMAASWPAAQQKHELLEQLTAQYIAKNPPDISSEEHDEGLKGHADPPVVDLAESFGTVNPYGSAGEPETKSIAPSAATPIQEISLPERPQQETGPSQQYYLPEQNLQLPYNMPMAAFPTGYTPPIGTGTIEPSVFQFGDNEANPPFIQPPPGLARWNVSALAPPTVAAPMSSLPQDPSTSSSWVPPADLADFDINSFEIPEWDVDTLAMLDPALWVNDGMYQVVQQQEQTQSSHQSNQQRQGHQQQYQQPQQYLQQSYQQQQPTASYQQYR